MEKGRQRVERRSYGKKEVKKGFGPLRGLGVPGVVCIRIKIVYLGVQKQVYRDTRVRSRGVLTNLYRKKKVLFFVWYNAIFPQDHSSQHDIHLEKASVLFNLGSLCTRIALSCDLTTIHGLRLAMDALNDASRWLTRLTACESRLASGTTDLSEHYINMIIRQFPGLKSKFPRPQSVESSSPIYPAYSAYNPVKYELFAYDPSDVTEQFLLGYCKGYSMVQEVCERQLPWETPPCLDLLSEVSPVKIKDGNLVANATLEAPNSALENMSLQETTLQ
ncbi:uncharacterized protein LOC107493036 [Arachis duranensis]|uniref:Uncharacterized protein LOC107493036 n=1 Tax=Arachis duranensis TaxID=130453 RepID=A0A6P5M8B1_ARADU|nr:uncharacterized protein LOC107493036 [Arachis duranensis]